MSKRLSNLDAALSYVARGWPVFPCHSIVGGVCTCKQKRACKKPGKHPRSRNGSKAATTDQAKIKRQWRAHADANIGIATGKVANLTVLDIDPRNDGQNGFKQLQDRLGKLPPCPCVRTGGDGWHLYFAYPGVKLRQPKVSGVDLKADGGYVLAVPSMHVSGRRYAWDIPPTKIAPPYLPDSWLAELTSGVYQGLPGDEVSTRGYQGLSGVSRGSNDIMRESAPNRFGNGPSIPLEQRIEQLIQKTLPTEPGQRHRGIFSFARGLKFMPEFQGQPVAELMPIVRQWHEQALPKIVNCREFEEEWWDFLESYESANKPLEANFMTSIRERAVEAPMPQVAERYENPNVQELIRVCREAQRERGTEPFFLSSIAVAEWFGIEQRRAHRWLKGLCADGILELVESGKEARKANAYRYLGSMEG